MTSLPDLAETVALQALELEALRHELEDTNRGVVALYAELDDKFRTLYAKAPSGICLLDAHGRIADANPALLRLLKRSLDAIVGRVIGDFVAPDWAGALDTSGTPAWQAEFPLVDAAGTRVHVQWSVSPFVEEGMSMAMATDVSERVLLHQARLDLLEREQAARQEAERVGRLKDDLIAVLSHELRTPLNAIMGWTHVLLQQPGGADTTLRGLKAIERNGKAQARLIADILDMSRINMDKLQLTLEWCDPGELVRSALEDMRDPAAARGVVLVAPPLAALRAIHADVGRLRQVIWNLVGNAIKFSQAGGRVEIALVEEADSLRVSIADEGHGIDPEFLPHLFERFSQGEAAATRTRGGLGLGLSIVKHLVELHGGTIAARSAGLGLGAFFDIRLPTEASRDGDRLHGPVTDLTLDDLPDDVLAGLKILLVDDDRDGLAVLEIVLSDRGAIVELAVDFEGGLQRAANFAPDLLLSDIGMPGRDGYALLRELRRVESPGKRLPAIALTAFSRRRDIDEALAAGFDAHCAKPWRPLELLRTIVRVTRRAA